VATPFESAQLILKLFELRRDPLMREARTWLVREFHPDTVEDVKATLAGEHSAKFRMVLGYWDMACSLVTHGAIDREMFLDANPELFASYSKVYLLMPGIRQLAAQPGFCKHIEEVLSTVPGVQERLEKLRLRFRAFGPAPAPAPAAAAVATS
jgi:hypothetical protein